MAWRKRASTTYRRAARRKPAAAHQLANQQHRRIRSCRSRSADTPAVSDRLRKGCVLLQRTPVWPSRFDARTPTPPTPARFASRPARRDAAGMSVRTLQSPPLSAFAAVAATWWGLRAASRPDLSAEPTPLQGHVLLKIFLPKVWGGGFHRPYKESHSGRCRPSSAASAPASRARPAPRRGRPCSAAGARSRSALGPAARRPGRRRGRCWPSA